MLIVQRHKKLTIASVIILLVLGLMYGSVYILCHIYLQPKVVKDLILSQAQKKLNRKITASDELDLSIEWDMSPHITLHKVQIANPSWAANAQMLTVDKFEFHFNLLPLLFKRLEIDSIHLINPSLYLE